MPASTASAPSTTRSCPSLSAERDLLAEELSQLADRSLDQAITAAIARRAGKAFVISPRGIRRDESAVNAAITLHWSNGPVEGHVNRLKLIKQQMFGRVGFALLKARVLNCGMIVSADPDR